MDDMLPPKVLMLRVLDRRSNTSLAQCGPGSDRDTVGRAIVGDTAVVAILMVVSISSTEVFICSFPRMSLIGNWVLVISCGCCMSMKGLAWVGMP